MIYQKGQCSKDQHPHIICCPLIERPPLQWNSISCSACIFQVYGVLVQEKEKNKNKNFSVKGLQTRDCFPVILFIHHNPGKQIEISCQNYPNMAAKQEINIYEIRIKQSDHTHIIRRRNAKENENGPRKKKLEISLQTCLTIRTQRLMTKLIEKYILCSDNKNIVLT